MGNWTDSRTSLILLSLYLLVAGGCGDGNKSVPNLATTFNGQDVYITGTAPSVIVDRDRLNDLFYTGQSVYLDASESYDEDGDIISYQWVNLTDSSRFELTNSDSSIAHFSATTRFLGSTLSFGLTITDDQGNVKSEVIEFELDVSEYNPPHASADGRAYIVSGEQGEMSADLSYDFDGQIASYLWEQVGGSHPVELSGMNTGEASFVSPVSFTDTYYEFQLTVTDNQGLSSTSTIVFQVDPSIICELCVSGQEAVFENSGRWLFGATGGFANLDGTKIYITDQQNNKVIMVDLKTGQEISQIQIEDTLSPCVRLVVQCSSSFILIDRGRHRV